MSFSQYKDFDFSHLSSSERLTLAQELLDSVVMEIQAPPLSDHQCREMERRVAEVKAGAIEVLRWGDVKHRLLARQWQSD